MDPTLDDQVDLHNLKMTCTLDYYPGVPALVISFTVTITDATCECDRLEWDEPALQDVFTTVKIIPAYELTIAHASVNVASTTASP